MECFLLRRISRRVQESLWAYVGLVVVPCWEELDEDGRGAEQELQKNYPPLAYMKMTGLAEIPAGCPRDREHLHVVVGA